MRQILSFGFIAASVLAFLIIVEVRTYYTRDLIAEFIYGSAPNRLPCDEWPTPAEVERAIEDNPRMVQRILAVHERAHLVINIWTCPGRAELLVYLPTREAIEKVKDMFEDYRLIFGVPSGLANF